jgi:c-di-GMP-binding flagellar brake protein YcgR
MNKRVRTRFRTDLSVKATCSDNPENPLKARLADLSAHGLSLIVREEMHIGSRVRVEWGDAAFEGELIYCEPRGDEFLIGLKVEDPVYDTAKSY